jgi:chromosome partitioning protein
MIVIAIVSQKGMGKTTTAVNLYYLALMEYKVLLIDLDPQGSTTLTWDWLKRFEEDHGT